MDRAILLRRGVPFVKTRRAGALTFTAPFPLPLCTLFAIFPLAEFTFEILPIVHVEKLKTEKFHEVIREISDTEDFVC